ncbi:glycosyltransferase [Actinomycetospora sp. TBRC 11914]|uniref:glycosyltransferase n=1 Tax=Actinomycetospora sp. TBRC 11914 TaxID=2729387 RepID=UPI00145E08C8|nr:glycosyltransferase [Actinomycetospora sp. TBRC 11914]NMO88238.1 glycosyltransferase [Actinomycetospora sp. TBRC 11914]
MSTEVRAPEAAPVATGTVAVVVPVYRNAATLPALVERLGAALAEQAWRVRLVVDGSPDDSAAVGAELAARDPRVAVTVLAQNVGQHRALERGLADEPDADAWVCLDADLQDPPEALPALLDALAGTVDRPDAVFAGRRGVYGTRGRRVTGALHRRAVSALTGLPPDAGAFLVLGPRAREAVLDARAPSLVAAIGAARLPVRSVPVARDARAEGASAWTGAARLRLSLRSLGWLVARRATSSSWVWWAGPAVLALVLGSVIVFGRAHGLWYDELYSMEVARRPLSEILRAAWEGHGTTWSLRDIPPSYNLPWYVLAHLWLWLVGSEADPVLRVLSLLAGAVGVAVLTRAVARLGGPRRIAVVAGLAVAANPLVLAWITEARPYGVAVLAVAGTALGLARWLDRCRGGLLLVGLAGAGAGLAHWFALLAVAGIVAGGAALAPRRSPALLVVGALAALPTAAMVELNRSTVGDRNAALLYDTELRLPLFAAWQWSGTDYGTALVVAVLGLLGIVRGARRLRVVALAWVGVPVALLLAVEHWVRPVYEPRYVLAALLGLGVLTACGAAGWSSRRVAVVLSVVLVAASLAASTTLLRVTPRERADDAAALIAAAHRPGDAVVAGDRQSALGLEHHVRTRHPQIAPDLRVPPVLAVPDPPVVWYVRVPIIRGETGPVDGDELLVRAGLRVQEQWFLRGTWTSLMVQRWVR